MSTTAASSAANTNTTAPSSILAPGTIAGVAIAGIFIGLIVFFLLGCLIASIRRRNLARQRELYNARNAPHMAGPPVPPPDDSSVYDRTRINDANSSNHRIYGAYQSMQMAGTGAPPNPGSVGVAVTSEMKHSISPASVRSNLSTSKLLPLRPPEQLRQKLNNRGSHFHTVPPSQGRSNMTMFEEEEDTHSTCSHDSQTPPHATPFSISHPTNRVSALRPKGTTGPLPRLLYLPPRINTSSSPTKPFPRDLPRGRPTSDITPLSPTYDPRNSPTRRSSISYLPAYYTRRSYFPASPALTEQLILSPALPPSKPPLKNTLPLPPAPANLAHKLPPPPPPTPPPKPTRSRSAASDGTSFESICSEQLTPPTEDLATSAIAPPPLFTRPSERFCSAAEATAITTVTAATEIRYPKVPRSTNLVIPRNVVVAATVPEKAPTTLLEKRRGAEAARDVERGLWWKDARNPGGETATAVAAGIGAEKRISRKPLAEQKWNEAAAHGDSHDVHIDSDRDAERASRATQGPAQGWYGTNTATQDIAARAMVALEGEKHGERITQQQVCSNNGGGNGGGGEKEMEMKSPVWQPKLTPTRWLGGEMVIEIS